MGFRKIILPFCLLTTQLFGQLEDKTPSIWLTLSGAMTFSIPPGYRFYSIPVASKIVPGIYASGGVVYGPLTIADPTSYSIAAEVSYINFGTEEPSSANANSQMNLRQLGAMVWLKLFVPAWMSPFVRGGIGLTDLLFQENYDSNISANTRLHYQTLTLAFGGGLDFSISERIELSVFGQGIYYPRKMPLHSNDGFYLGTYGNVGTLAVGIQSNIRF